MPRKLKTYQASLGFFEQAIAAPSMKAALEAWGSRANLFHDGVAKESTDPEIIAATMAKPGVVLKRPVGTTGAFTEHAQLPTNLVSGRADGKPATRHAEPRKQPQRVVDEKAAGKAALAFERAEKRRESERRKEEAAENAERERRERAIAKAQAALDEAERDHEARASAIESKRAALDQEARAEDARWEKQRQQLNGALRRARD